jgi:hypothetical protein
MCTVTVIPLREGTRLACNRDERNTRAGALPPVLHRFGRRRALLPVDPGSGGTWVAVSDAGLALALLNATPPPELERRPQPGRSRGTVLPALLGSADLAAAVEGVLGLDPQEFAPFRVVLANGSEVAEVHSDGQRLRLVACVKLTAPRLFTSSGLGDEVVQGPRAALFARAFGPSADWAAAQDAFHRHSWPDRTHLSICMRRPDARTVSYTVVTLGPSRATMAYHAGAPDRPDADYRQSLDLREGGVPCPC